MKNEQQRTIEARMKKEREDTKSKYPQFDLVRLGAALLTCGILLFLANLYFNVVT